MPNLVIIGFSFLSAAAIVSAQTRQNDAAQARTGPPQETNANGESQGQRISVSKDPLSTSITAAQTAMGPGDLLDITVFDTPELTERVRVDSEGKITLPLIGEISVRGTTARALENVIRGKLIDGSFVKDPQVSVFIAEYAGQMAYVTGEVTRPGAYALLRSHLLLDLISVAGGLTSRASNTVTILRGDGPAQHILVDLSDKDETRSNPEILPGDSITVGQSGIVYVLGDVNRPGGFMLDRRTTLSVVQAVALAEGTKSSASLSKAILVRTIQGKRQETPLNLKMIMKSQNPDLVLQASDILYVPGSVMRGMGKTSLEVLESSAGLAAVYTIRP
jgi:polysaccharide export outer membrane protein